MRRKTSGKSVSEKSNPVFQKQLQLSHVNKAFLTLGSALLLRIGIYLPASCLLVRVIWQWQNTCAPSNLINGSYL